MTQEQDTDHIQHYSDGSSPIVRVDIDIPGLKPEQRDSSGKIRIPNNLPSLSVVTRKVLSEKPWFGDLLRSVRQHEKSAIFVTSLGGIAIFVAGVAGFEFGVRHGQDLQLLPKHLKRHPKK